MLKALRVPQLCWSFSYSSELLQLPLVFLSPLPGGLIQVFHLPAGISQTFMDKSPWQKALCAHLPVQIYSGNLLNQKCQGFVCPGLRSWRFAEFSILKSHQYHFSLILYKGFSAPGLLYWDTEQSQLFELLRVKAVNKNPFYFFSLCTWWMSPFLLEFCITD